jgi:hypothetical protein
MKENPLRTKIELVMDGPFVNELYDGLDHL